MKKTAFILLLFVSSFCWSQQFIVTEGPNYKKKATVKEPGKKYELLETNEPEVKMESFSEEEYATLLNQVPKSFSANTKMKPQNRVLRGDLNSIGSLEIRYAYQQQLKLNESEIKWLEGEINSLATAFFTDGMPIILKKTGEYGNCVGRNIQSEERNRQTVTVLSFCYTCPGAAEYEDRFLEIFNKRTEALIASKQAK